MPVSTSPMPALAIPGLPEVLMCQSPAGRRADAAGAFQTPRARCTWRRAAVAAATRSSCTSRVDTPSSRAASAGCGVSRVGALRAASCGGNAGVHCDQVQRIRVEHQRQRRFQRPVEIARGVGQLPSPGPTARQVRWSSFSTSSARADHQLGLAGIERAARRGRAGRRRPGRLPSLSAARAASSAAPTMPWSPPMMPTLP